MTTIVCNRTTMAADSMMHDEVIKGSVDKLYRMKDGSVMGIAGDLADCLDFISYLEGKRSVPPDDMSGVSLIHLRHHGVFLYQCSSTAIEMCDDFVAIGSGAMAALAVMYISNDPQKAVEIAAKIDPFTGGEVDVMKLEPPAPKPRGRKISGTPDK